MARAHSVYVVFLNTHPLAGFTVKRDCQAWLERNWPSCPTNMRVMQMSDGGHGKPQDITAKLYLEELSR